MAAEATHATAQAGGARVGENEHLLFEVEEQRYAVSAAIVVEVVRAVAITPLPRAPRIILGVVNVRGQLAPVLDLRRRFGWPDRALDAREHLVVLRGPRRALCLRVDRALGLSHLPPDALESPEAVVPGATRVSGIGRLPDGVLLVYDLPAFLSDSEALAVDAAMGQLDDGGGRA
jgi:purine-binding chemotaxis protein CheW